MGEVVLSEDVLIALQGANWINLQAIAGKLNFNSMEPQQSRRPSLTPASQAPSTRHI